MVHGSRGVEIKRRYCFFRQANANGKIVARTRKRATRSGKNRTLPRINARFYVLFTSLGMKVNELHVTDQKILYTRRCMLRVRRLYRLLRHTISVYKNVINAIWFFMKRQIL